MVELQRLHHFLSAQMQKGQLSHAYIFSGDDSLEQAVSLAASLNCEQPLGDGSACGQCLSCHQIQAETFPDLHILEPESGKHKVEAMRQLVNQASLSMLSGKYKVFILEQGEKITIEGANTLLKILEEPDSRTVFILLVQQLDLLFPTILSRCQVFLFEKSRVNEPELPPELMDQAGELIRNLPGLAMYQVLLLAKDHDMDREDQERLLLALLKNLHLAAKKKISLPMSQDALIRSAELLEHSLDLLGKNINQKLLMDVVFLRLKQNCAG